MQNTKRKIVGMMAAVVAVVLTLALALPRAFATQDYFETNEALIDYDAMDRVVTLELKAQQAFTLYSIEGNFAIGTEDDTLLTTMTPSVALTEVAPVIENSTSDGKFYWKNAAAGVSFAAGDVIWTTTYTVADELAVGDYNLPITLDAFSFGSTDTHEDEIVEAKITVVAVKADQVISFADDEVNKTWGDDDFTIAASHPIGDGTVTYSSTDTNIATVDSESGAVEITGVGEVEIRATAAETEAYNGATTSYVLKVAKKTVSITSAGVSDRTYNGTTVADVSSVVLSEDGLDYDASAEFASADAGAGKDATVTVTLTGASDEHYTLGDNNTFATTGTISPFAVKNVNIIPIEAVTYSGSENEPEVMIMVQLDGVADTILTPEVDFDVTYPLDTASAGEKIVTVATKGNYTDGGDLATTYVVNPYEITTANIILEYPAVHYDGTAKTPAVTVKIGDFTVESDEYDVDYTDNVNPGLATVSVTAKSNMNITGSAETTFEITNKKVLDISGISSQSVVYTGSPVVLVGTLTVGPNTDGITVADVVTKWYDGETELASVPIVAGNNYKVVYSVESANYVGSLEVPFVITKATSPEPVEARDGFEVEVGTSLSAIPGTRTVGFSWVNPATTVAAGDHDYAATYTYNGDTDNYTTRNFNVLVYGLTRIAISSMVDGDAGTILAPVTALEGDNIEITLVPAEGYETDKVLLNAIDVTSALEDNMLVISAGTTDIDVVASFHKIYEVVEGDGASYDASKGGAATFKINAEKALFDAGGKVYVNGALVASKYYTVASGSTVVTLSEEFIATLPSGTHTLMVVFSDGGVARASFIVSNSKKDVDPKAPDTGFFTGATSAKIAGFTAIIVTLAGLLIVFRKKFAKSKIDFDNK